MIFEIDFNRTNDNEFLIKKLKAKRVEGVDYYALTIDVKDFEHLEKILDLVDFELGDFYSAVISFDPPIIYLDNKV